VETKKFVVPNISCGHCVHTIQNELGDLAGVKQVKADQQTKEVVVEWESPATWTQIATLLTEIDYPPAQATAD
jgi:copper chaperone CopZ